MHLGFITWTNTFPALNGRFPIWGDPTGRSDGSTIQAWGPSKGHLFTENLLDPVVNLRAHPLPARSLVNPWSATEEVNADGAGNITIIPKNLSYWVFEQDGPHTVWRSYSWIGTQLSGELPPDWSNNGNAEAVLAADRLAPNTRFKPTSDLSGSAWNPRKPWTGHVVWGDSHVDWHWSSVMPRTRTGTGYIYINDDIYAGATPTGGFRISPSSATIYDIYHP